MFVPVIMEKISQLSNVIYERSEAEENVSKTRISITSIVAVGNDRDFIFFLANNGTTKLWDFKNFDVIVTYDQQNPKDTITFQPSYRSGNCGGSNSEWCIQQFIDDYLDPEILNPEEGVEIFVDLPSTKRIDNTGGKVRVIISTDTGVVATKAVKAQ